MSAIPWITPPHVHINSAAQRGKAHFRHVDLPGRCLSANQIHVGRGSSRICGVGNSFAGKIRSIGQYVVSDDGIAEYYGLHILIELQRALASGNGRAQICELGRYIGVCVGCRGIVGRQGASVGRLVRRLRLQAPVIVRVLGPRVRIQVDGECRHAPGRERLEGVGVQVARERRGVGEAEGREDARAIPDI